MAKRVIYPQGVWGLFARSWELALRADNKSDNTIWAYIQAVRLLGEWAYRQEPAVEPTEVQPIHLPLTSTRSFSRLPRSLTRWSRAKLAMVDGCHSKVTGSR